jgi:hypothetical protein
MLGKSRLLEALRHFLSHQTVNLIFQLNVVQAFHKGNLIASSSDRIEFTLS